MIDIRVEGLVKSFDLEKKILDGLTFQVDTGERVGLLGRNGAGKTTLFKILTGELDYDSGTVQIASGRRVGLISQIPVYPEGYTVEDVLRTAFARMFRMKDEMDALTLAMEQGASDDATLRRYGELNARFEGLGGWDTDTAVNKVANGLSISDEACPVQEQQQVYIPCHISVACVLRFLVSQCCRGSRSVQNTLIGINHRVRTGQHAFQTNNSTFNSEYAFVDEAKCTTHIALAIISALIRDEQTERRELISTATPYLLIETT